MFRESSSSFEDVRGSSGTLRPERRIHAEKIECLIDLANSVVKIMVTSRPVRRVGENSSLIWLLDSQRGCRCLHLKDTAVKRRRTKEVIIGTLVSIMATEEYKFEPCQPLERRNNVGFDFQVLVRRKQDCRWVFVILHIR